MVTFVNEFNNYVAINNLSDLEVNQEIITCLNLYNPDVPWFKAIIEMLEKRDDFITLYLKKCDRPTIRWNWISYVKKDNMQYIKILNTDWDL